jgi:diguanylate cyclase (GGDEF)-like protein/PAS domain S-box-containing protein
VGGAARRWNTVDWLLAADTVKKEPDGSLNRVVIGRIASTAFIVASALFLVSDLLFPGSYSKASTLMVGGLTLVAGFASWWIPWEHLPRSTVLWMVPFALFAVDLGYVYAVRNGFNYSVTFVIIFVLVGLTQPRWTSLQLAPLLVVAYVLPLLITSDHLSTSGLGSAIYVVPVCLMLGEATAWGMSRLAEASSEIAEGEESIRQLFDEAPIGISRMGVDGRILEVNRAFGEIVGSPPEDLVGLDILALTHPDDVAETTSLIARLLTGEIDRYQIEKRYVHADGHLVWVSVNGTVVRDANGRPIFLIGQIEDIAERRALREELALHAVTDPLTGLPNRSLFMEHLGSALPRAEAAGRHVALMFLDLDRFKLVNDGIGHDAGDRLLKRVGQRLRGALRSGDVLARFGGDEFTVLCEVVGEDEVMDVVQRLRQALSTPVAEPDFEQFVSLSIGVALSNSESMVPAVLLRCADVAMYQAKGLGPGRYVIYEDRDDGKAGHNLRTSNELHRAILGSQLVLHYQPYVNVDDLQVVGTEALVRWQHPERGLLPPGEFVELAEECGLMVQLGAWVLHEACRQGAQWMVARTAAGVGGRIPTMSVNISPQQLSEPGFADVVARVLDDTGFPAERLWLEITEGALLRDPAAAIAILQALRALDVHLSIDDFGTGYSSLSYLKRLPVEALKIDSSFVEQLEHGADDRAIVEAIVALGRTLGLGIVAEGIERPDQAIELAGLGCNIAQGFLYARPADPAAIGAYLPQSVADWESGSRFAPLADLR